MSDYDINAVTRRQVFSGSAGTGPYSFTFEVLDSGDVAVYKNATKLTISTDYTVTVNANGTGDVNLVVAATSSDNITIIGARDIERTTDFVTAGDLRASALNEQLDGQIIMIQQIAEENKRQIAAPVEDPEHVDDGGTLDMTLPAKDDRKGKYLSFNATTGNPEAGPDTDNVNTLAAITDDIATLADIEDGTDATDAIQTVAGISSNVTTVAGISGNVTTVAGISSDVTTVAGDATDIGTVAGDSADIQALADISTDIQTLADIEDGTDATDAIQTVAGDSADIQALAAITTEISRLGTADAVADLNTLATSAIVTDMDALADITADIEALGDIATDIQTLADIEDGTDATDAIQDVAGVASDVTTVAGQISPTNNLSTVAGISSDVTAVAGVATEVGRLGTADAVSDMNTLGTAAIVADMDTLADISADIQTLADIEDGTTATNAIQTVATNVTDVTNFSDVYIGPSASAPTVRTDSSALQVGDLYFDTATDTMKVYTSSGWAAAGSSVNGTSERQNYVVGTSSGSYDGSTTVFPATYDAGFVDVYLNGVKLVVGTDFTATNGTSVTLSTAATSGDAVNIIGYGTFELANFSINDANDVATSGVTDGQVLAYNNSTGDFEPTTIVSATGGGSDEVFYENDATITTSYTISSNKNAMSAGPLTINSGATVTVNSGSSWTIVGV